MEPIRGTVVALTRWPVKSMGGEPVDELRVDERGVGGDRTHALHRGGHPFTARQSRHLLAWSAAYGGDVDPADPPLPVLTAPDGRAYRWDDPQLPGALPDGVELRRDVRGQQDVPGTVHLITEASLQALRAELGAPGLDARRFRANVHADLDAPPFAEERWTGPVRIGDAEFEVDQPCLRCAIPTFDPETQERAPRLLKHLVREHGSAFGVYLRPLRPAVIRLGDSVR